MHLIVLKYYETHLVKNTLKTLNCPPTCFGCISNHHQGVCFVHTRQHTSNYRKARGGLTTHIQKHRAHKKTSCHDAIPTINKQRTCNFSKTKQTP